MHVSEWHFTTTGVAETLVEDEAFYRRVSAKGRDSGYVSVWDVEEAIDKVNKLFDEEAWE